MLYVALKELRYHGKTYLPGSSLPDGIGRWPELRHCQRRGVISKTRQPLPAVPPQVAESAPVEPVETELATETASAASTHKTRHRR